ncbi:MAG: acyl-ACP--UDP-N-acetylglucosamine O-acyltransferase [Nitrospinaceae bacterium]
MSVHKYAEIHPDADLGENISIGPFAVIGPNVRIGAGTEIGPHVVIRSGTIIGPRCRIFHGASIGGDPQMVHFEDTPSGVEIGEECVIREFVTIHRSAQENENTRIGKNVMLMAYAHIAHDCGIGDHAIIVNGTGLSGHVIVEDFAFISGQVGVHQFVRIGRNAMVGGASAVSKDILPFSLVEGAPARLVSINSIGLRRNHFPPGVRAALKKALKFLLDPDLNTTQAVDKMKAEIEMFEEIRYLIEFINNSSRGITK